ncbi:MAG: ATP-dependent sacrificial sulfur transferase LarE [Thermoleophilia bacterium]
MEAAGAALPPSYEALAAVLAPLDRLCVAFSGGVDSSLLLAVAARTLGTDRVLAFTAVSETYRDDELAGARAFAADRGVSHVVARTAELADENFSGNPRRRCYYCKRELLGKMRVAAAAAGMSALADGANRDDLGDERPGLEAAAEAGVRHPLIEAGLDKAAVRELSRVLGLPTWDKPQQACLASRVPYGSPITAQKLRQIAAGEDVLRDLGFTSCRLRHHGDVARLEVAVADIERASGITRATLTRRLHGLGFTYVTLDLDGFRSGSMNEGPS